MNFFQEKIFSHLSKFSLIYEKLSPEGFVTFASGSFKILEVLKSTMINFKQALKKMKDLTFLSWVFLSDPFYF